MPRGKAAGGAAKKPRAPKAHQLPEKFNNGEKMRDLCKKDWRLGDVIGQGGFGLIYLATDRDINKVGPDAEYVIKIEPIANGPLFCELHFYQRVAKQDLIDPWIKARKLRYLGVPRYIASGQHMYKGSNYRFMVMQRFSTDLQKLFEDAGKQFSSQTVFALALRLIDALEYLHEMNYTHADIKASNCLLGFRAGKPDPDMVYLVDYGLASKYQFDGDHKEYKEDPKKAHDGTIEFTSIDAHKGCGVSRRGDLEILGYCLLQWLCGQLPWEDKLTNKEYVKDAKIRYMKDIPSLMKKCFPHGGAPDEISTYLKSVMQLKYEEKPKYDKLREIFQKGLGKLGAKDQWKLALPKAGAAPKSQASPKKGVKRKSTGEVAAPAKQKARIASPGPSTGEVAAPAKQKARIASPGPSTSKPAKPATPKPAKAATPRTKTGTPKAKTGTPKSPKAATPKAGKRGTPKTGKTARARTPKTAGTSKGIIPGMARSKTTAIKGVVSPIPAQKRLKLAGAKSAANAIIPGVSGRNSRGKGAHSPANAIIPGMLNGANTPRGLMSPRGDSPAPKRRKVVRRKDKQVSETAVQTTPGLKQNR